jgi:hypothetical protein
MWRPETLSGGDPMSAAKPFFLLLFFFNNSLLEIFTITCKERLSFVKSRCDHDALVHHANEFISVLATGLDGSGRSSL